jgi:hypothetical protein
VNRIDVPAGVILLINAIAMQAIEFDLVNKTINVLSLS